ncbi:MAG: N-acetylmuramoyl-L-alanine amidase, partial [Bacteroidia bacterium]|nr:N-acetylmuramoyl-L-alanine amidase [Bacteroidia bacterium]
MNIRKIWKVETLHATSLLSKKHLKFSILIILLNYGLMSYAFSQGKTINDEKFKIRTIVLDAGHGGKDPGAVCKKGYEKDIALNIVLALGHYIDSLTDDINVIYTRKTDEFVELHKRAQMANSNKADLFVSVHVNANKSNAPFGAETYVMGVHLSEENLNVAKMENSVILKEDDYQKQYEGFDPNSSEGYIIFSLLQNIYLEQSLAFATKVQKQFKESAHRTDRGIKQAGFLVLWKTTMPSVLI